MFLTRYSHISADVLQAIYSLAERGRYIWSFIRDNVMEGMMSSLWCLGSGSGVSGT